MAGERGAGVSIAGDTPPGAKTDSAGRRTPLAVMLWGTGETHSSTQKYNQRAQKRGGSRETAESCFALGGREKFVYLSLNDR